MKPSFGSDYLDDNITQFTKIHFILFNRGYDINRGHYLKRVVINIRASKIISGLVKVSVTSPAGLMTFFLNVEPWGTSFTFKVFLIRRAFRKCILCLG